MVNSNFLANPNGSRLRLENSLAKALSSAKVQCVYISTQDGSPLPVIGFSYGTTAWYKDSASTTPISFSVDWESRNQPGGVLSLFFRAALSCNIFTFTLTNSIKAAIEEKHQISLSPNHSAKTAQSPTTEQTLVSFNRVRPRAPPPPAPVSFSLAGAGTCYTPPNKTQIHQSTRKIQEPGETYPNSSGLSEEADGHKGPLLVPRLRFLLEFRRRREVHSGSLIRGRYNS